MKAITIRQPWAWAILHAGKTIENRDWRTRVRGRVAIHAAKGCTSSEYWDAHIFMRRILGYAGLVELKFPGLNTGTLPLGAIVGTVEIVDCVSQSDSPWFVGDYGFVLRDPIALPEPIPCRGMLNFWEVPAAIVRQMEAQP